MPRPKEDIEKDVEGDIRRRKEQEKKIEDLSEKVNTIGDQVEGLTKSINNLVNVMQKQVGGPTNFDNKYDELKDEKEEGDEPSSSEFGMGKSDESLVRAKEESLMPNAGNLRTAREKRLTGEELQFHEKNPPNKKYTQQVVGPPSVKTTKDEPKDWDEYYNKLTAANLALDRNAVGTEWSVVDKTNNEVFFKIHPTAETADNFPTKEFAEQIIRDIKQLGLKSAMEKYGAEPFSSGIFKRKDKGEPEKPVGGDKKPFSSDLLKPKDGPKVGPKVGPTSSPKPFPKAGPKMMTKGPKPVSSGPTGGAPGSDVPKSSGMPAVKAADETEVPVADAAPAEEVVPEVAPAQAPVATPEKIASLEDVTRRFMRAFRLALSAQQKNLVESPLKAAWYETLKGMDVDNPEAIIEATFNRAAAEHFEIALAKTAEYLKMGDEAFVQVESEIGELDILTPRTASEQDEEEIISRSAKLRARALRNSLPLSTSTNVNPEEDKVQRLASALPKPKLIGAGKYLRK
jgi:hypothetical protein